MRISIFNNKRQQRYSDCEIFMEILSVVAVVFFMVGIVWLCALAHPALAFTVGSLLLAAISALATLYFKGRAAIESETEDDDRQQS